MANLGQCWVKWQKRTPKVLENKGFRGFCYYFYSIVPVAIGTVFPVPVEIVSEARVTVTKALEKLSATCVLRQGVRKAGPVITDNGNLILDATWEKAPDAPKMETLINQIVGVVENGLFCKTIPTIYTAHPDGTVSEW